MWLHDIVLYTYTLEHTCCCSDIDEV
jgi:hypothetical protein